MNTPVNVLAVLDTEIERQQSRDYASGIGPSRVYKEWVATRAAVAELIERAECVLATDLRDWDALRGEISALRAALARVAPERIATLAPADLDAAAATREQAEGDAARVTDDDVRNALHLCPTDIPAPAQWRWIAERLNAALAARELGKRATRSDA